MKIHVENMQLRRPAAFVLGIDNPPHVNLGVNRLAGFPLPPYLGINLDLARAEEVPINLHNAFHEYTEHLGLTEKTIAMLGILSNFLLPKELGHLHPELSHAELVALWTMDFSDKKNLARIGINQLRVDLDRNPEHYKMNLRSLNHEAFNHFDSMLTAMEPNPRNFRVDAHGIMTRVK